MPFRTIARDAHPALASFARGAGLALAIAAVAACSASSAGAVAIPYSGSLSEGGVPVTGTRHFEIALYAGAFGGSSLFGFVDSLEVTGGVYHVDLDTPASVWDGSDRWLGVRVNSGAELSPRVKIGWVPYAVRSLRTPPSTIVRPIVQRTVHGSAWTAIDSLTITTAIGGVAMLNMSGNAVWSGSISAPGCAIAIDQDVPTEFVVATSSNTDQQPVSVTKMVTLAPGSHTYRLWVWVAAVGQSYGVRSTFQSLFLPND